MASAAYYEWRKESKQRYIVSELTPSGKYRMIYQTDDLEEAKKMYEGMQIRIKDRKTNKTFQP